MDRSKSRGTSGNVLFLILIAVALFAGLSYVISQSTRSGSGSTEKEWIKMAKAQVDNVALTMSTSTLRHEFKTNCRLSDIQDNFCPPTTAPATCAAVPRPDCNILNITSPDRPVFNWAGGMGPAYIMLSGGQQNNRVLFSLWGGSALSATINLVFASFEIEDSPTYMNFGSWRTLCEENNSIAGLPAPDVIGAMASGPKNALYLSNGMNGPLCELDTGATPDKITLRYPIRQDSY